MSQTGHLLSDVRRALEALRPEDAEDLLREVELRLGGAAGSRGPGVPRGRLFDEIAPAVRASFPDRASGILVSLQRALWPRGVLGPVSILAPAGTGDGLDLERDSFPSFVLLQPAGSVPAGLRLLLFRDSMVIGRSAEADFHFDEPSLARKHLRITLDARDQVFLEDLGGANGVFVNGKRTHETWMTDGDTVHCGRLALRFLAPAR